MYSADEASTGRKYQASLIASSLITKYMAIMGQTTNRDITFNNYFSIILRLKQIGSPEHKPNKIELI